MNMYLVGGVCVILKFFSISNFSFLQENSNIALIQKLHHSNFQNQTWQELIQGIYFTMRETLFFFLFLLLLLFIESELVYTKSRQILCILDFRNIF